MRPTIALFTGDRAATLELGRSALRGLRWGGGVGTGIILHMIADALSEARPDAAAIIHGAADTHAAAPPNPAAPASPVGLAGPDQEHARELRARGGPAGERRTRARPPDRRPGPDR